jgi:DNA replication initiation complex subunit (GINS family)
MAGEEEVSFERITRVYREESGKRTLSTLEADFYDKLRAYVSDLEARLAAEREKDPNSAKTLLLQDELRKATKKREQIYRYRERKIALLAATKASGAETDLRPLTKEEQALFRDLVEVFGTARHAVFAVPAREPRREVGKDERGVPATKEPSPPTEGGDLVVVHVLEDVPPFAGIDVTYRLRKEDVVTLPRKFADVLIERGKAREVQVASE